MKRPILLITSLALLACAPESEEAAPARVSPATAVSVSCSIGNGGPLVDQLQNFLSQGPRGACLRHDEMPEGSGQAVTISGGSISDYEAPAKSVVNLQVWVFDGQNPDCRGLDWPAPTSTCGGTCECAGAWCLGYTLRPDEGTAELSSLFLKPATGAELCNGLDDDCDGVADEGVLNACGGCGALGAEICDGQDDDCDGRIDEGVLNACGQCGPLAADACNGVDDDCDGTLDEDGGMGCCREGETRPCGTEVGQCSSGQQRCTNTAWGNCEGGQGSIGETCNTFDDDCDGNTDEAVLNACGRCGDVPAEVCNNADDDCDGRMDEGVLNACGRCGGVPNDVCNGLDDDCDGRIDENVINACGACGPVPGEVCDGRDNDCDDAVDEGVANACGECGPVPAELCDGVDNDCDRQIDEGFGIRLWNGAAAVDATQMDRGDVASGNLEFCAGGWQTICDDGFDAADASVVCRELGLAPIEVECARPVRTGAFALESLQCNGSEGTVSACASACPLNAHNCRGAEAVIVQCGKGVCTTPVDGTCADGTVLEDGCCVCVGPEDNGMCAGGGESVRGCCPGGACRENEACE